MEEDFGTNQGSSQALRVEGSEYEPFSDRVTSYDLSSYELSARIRPHSEAGMGIVSFHTYKTETVVSGLTYRGSSLIVVIPLSRHSIKSIPVISVQDSSPHIRLHKQ